MAELCPAVVHYDLLIDEGNDPVRDPQVLKDYMDKWDGQEFIDKMELVGNERVLEIGVGTGRLGLRVAPLCGEFVGIDISPKTVLRAEENFDALKNVRLICGDFLTFEFDEKFDVIYSSLTFMHIEDKCGAMKKISELLNADGRVVISLDKNSSEFIDMGTRRIKVFPDSLCEIKGFAETFGLKFLGQSETEFANIFTARKQKS